MAISAVAGLATAIGAAAAAGGITGALVFFGLKGWAAFAAWAALGAGLSMVSRALAPKPNLGAQLRGITQTTREPAGSRKLVYGKMRVGGQVVFISHSGDDNKYLHMAIAFASHEIESFEEIWFNDKKVWTTAGFQSDWGTYVTIDRKFGTATQTASTQLKNAHVQWTDNHKLSGIAYVAFKLEWNQDKFPQGVPNITAVIKGKKVYDPRDSNQSATDASTWTYSTNPALCLRDYLVDQKYGLGEDRTLIDSTALTAAANLCEETQNDGVDIYSTSGQKRYQLNGVIDAANNIKDNIEQMLSAMGGNLTYSGGKYFIKGAEYVAPTVTFDEADCVSEITLQTKQSRRGIYNGVKGIFVAENKNWKVLDYPAQISSTYEAEDGDPIYLDMPLPFVTNEKQAQLLAKLALLRSRQQTVLQVTVNLKGLQVKVGDTVNITNTRLGYSSKVFEVIEYSLSAPENGPVGVDLTLIETGSAVYDWTTSDEQDFLSGGELDLYDGRTVDNVTSLSHSVTGLKGPDGKNITTVDFTWTAPTDAFIEFYVVTLEKDDDGNVFEYQTREPRLRVPNLDIGSAYEVIVKAQNLIGVRSSGTTLNIASLAGDITPPAKPTNFTATGGVRQITVQWDDPTDEDFALTRIFIADSDSIPATSSKTRGSEFVYTLADDEDGEITKYFWLKSEDYSGNVSAATASFTGTSKFAASDDVNIVAGDVGLGNVENRDSQDQVETGIETGATVTAGGITLSGGGSIKGGQTEYDDADAAGFFLGYSGATYKFSIGNSDNSKKLTFDGSDLTVTGAIKGGSIQSNNTNPIPTNIFTRTGVTQNIPTGNESGAFLDLSGGSFVFGDADSFISFAENSAGTAFELDIKGVLAPTTLDLSAVTDTTVMPSNIKASGYTDASIGVDALSSAVWTEIDSRVGQGTGGFYASATGNYLGTSSQYITLASTPDHGVEDVTIKVVVSDTFAYPINYTYGSTATQINVSLFYKPSTDSDWTNEVQAGTTQTFQANPTLLQYATRYTIDANYSVTLTSGSGADIADNTDYDFRVKIARVTSPTVFMQGGSGGANDSTGTPITLEVSENASGVAATGGNADTLDNLNSTQFLRSDQSDTLSGSLTITGDLTVQGSQTSLEVATLQVEDKNIVLNYGTGDTSGSANGAGITIQDGVSSTSDATLLWDTSDDRFKFSHGTRVTSNNWYQFGPGPMGASVGSYGMGNKNNSSARQLTFHVPNIAAYSNSGTIPSFGWYSNGSVQLMTLESDSGDLWVKGDVRANTGDIKIGTNTVISSGRVLENLLQVNTDLKFPRDHTIYFQDGADTTGNSISVTNYPSAGFSTSTHTYWLQYATRGGHHFVVNTDGGANSAENAYDHWTLWQGAMDGQKLFHFTNVGKAFFTNDVDLGSKDLKKVDQIFLSRALAGADYDAINIAYRGSWSTQQDKIAGVHVTDSDTQTQTVGRFGITYGSGGGSFVVTDLYDGGYGASGDVLRVRGNGNLEIQGGLYPNNQSTNYVSSSRIANWQTAYGWGDHGAQPYAKKNVANTFSAVQTFEGTNDANFRLHVTSANVGWDAVTFQSTTEWGDTPKYGVLGGDGAEGIMLRRPHIVWNSSASAADIRLGRSGGTSSGKWVGMGVGTSDTGFLAMEHTRVLTWDSSYNVQIPAGHLVVGPASGGDGSLFRANGGWVGDATNDATNVPLVVQATGADTTVFGALNRYGRQAFAMNISGSADSTSQRGKIDFYTKTDGTFRKTLTLDNGEVETHSDLKVTDGKIKVKRGTGLTTTIIEDDSSANGRGQLLLDSHYSDMIIASRNTNANKHGSTLTFATQSTSTNDYAKIVIGQGQHQEGNGLLAFAHGVNHTNPHNILGTDNANAGVVMDLYNKKLGVNDVDPISRIQINPNTFSGGNGVYADSRLGMMVNGALTSYVYASTYNDANYPDYGFVFIHGPNTSSYNVWSISPDGPAKGDSLNFIYGNGVTNIHAITPKVIFDGSGDVGIGVAPSARLHVLEATTEQSRFAYDANNYTAVNYDGLDTVGGSMTFSISGVEKARLSGDTLQLQSGNSGKLARWDIAGNEGRLLLSNGVNWGLSIRGVGNTPYIGAYHGGSINFVANSVSNGGTLNTSKGSNGILFQIDNGGNAIRSFTNHIVVGRLESNINGNNTSGGNLFLGITTNNSNKWGQIVQRQYNHTNESEGFNVIGSASGNGSNSVYIGGAFAETNAATNVYIYAAANQNTRAGTQVVEITSANGLNVKSGALRMNGTESINQSNDATFRKVTATGTGMSTFATNLSNNEDWQNSPISLRERGLVQSTQSADKYSPNLNYHWAGKVSRSIWMDQYGDFHFGEYATTGIPNKTNANEMSDINVAAVRIANTAVIDATRNATFGQVTVTDFVKASGNNLKFSAGGNHIMNIDLNGKVYPQTDNATDLGFSTTAARFRDLFLSGNANVPTVRNTASAGLTLGHFTGANADQWPYVSWYRDAANGWDEGLIKGSSSRGVFGRSHFGIHFDDSKSFGFHTSGWDTEMEINGDGLIYMKGPVAINATPSNSNYGPLGRKANFHVRDHAAAGTNSTIVVECNDTGESSLYLCETSGSSGYGARLYYEGSGSNFFNIEIVDDAGATKFPTAFTIDRDAKVGINKSGPVGRLDVHQTYNGPTMCLTSSNPSTWGASLLIGNTVADQTLVDANDRPMVVIDGNYPVLNLNHTTTSNDNHGPTIQFTHEGYNSNRQWVIGTDGQGQRLDFGVSGGTAGSNTNKNPHNGIAGYSGVTIMRLFQNGVLIGSTGTYPNEIASISKSLDVRGNVAIAGSGGDSDPLLRIEGSASNTFNHAVHVLHPNLTTGEANIIVLGQAASTRNAGYIGYYRGGGSGSYDNFMSIGLWSNDHLFRFYPGGDFHNHVGSILKTSYNQAYMLKSSGTSSSGSAIGFQQITAEGWSGIFVDYNPYEGWGLYHDNPSNFFYITAENTTGSLGTSFTVPNRGSGTSTAYAKIRFNQNNGNIDLGGALSANGNVTAYASDRRLKTNFRKIDSAVSKVRELTGFVFDWNEVADEHGFTPDRKHDDVGLIAQEVQAIVPQAVELAPFDTEVISTPIDKADKNAGNIEEKRSVSGHDFLTVNYSKLVPLLVNAIKEQAEELDQLKAIIKEMQDGHNKD